MAQYPMASTKDQTPADSIRSELNSTHSAFHIVLDSFSEIDLQHRSLNPGWTNGEILTHMVFGFVIVIALLPMVRIWGRLPGKSSKWFALLLNAFTRPFNWVNKLGARLQGRVVNFKHIGPLFDRTVASLLKKVDSITDEEWQHGMYFPNRWDPNFNEFMTLEMVFRYPVIHFNFHTQQLSHGRMTFG
ncbi:MAG: hypothetical protein WBV22_08055 [Anaerolineaceae bacterium]